jgi:hypothetical protein
LALEGVSKRMSVVIIFPRSGFAGFIRTKTVTPFYATVPPIAQTHVRTMVLQNGNHTLLIWDNIFAVYPTTPPSTLKGTTHDVKR